MAEGDGAERLLNGKMQRMASREVEKSMPEQRDEFVGGLLAMYAPMRAPEYHFDCWKESLDRDSRGHSVRE